MTASEASAGSRTRLPLPAVLTLGAMGFLSVTIELLPAGLLPEIAADLQESESRAGLLTAAYAGVIVVTVLPLTAWTRALRRRDLLLASVVVLGASNMLVSLCDDLVPAVLCRLLGGAAHGVLWACMAPYAVRLVPPDKVGRAMAVVFAGNSVGVAAGAPLATALGQAVGWRGAFVVVGSGALALAALTAWLLPRLERDVPPASDTIRAAVRRPGVTAIATAWPITFVGHFAMLTFIAPFLAFAGLPDTMTGLSLCAMGVAGVLGSWVAGLTADRVPRRSMLAAKLFLVLTLLSLATVPGGTVVVLALAGLWGASLSAVCVYNQAALMRAAGPVQTAATSLLVVVTQLGIAVGAVYGGLVLPLLGLGMLPVAAAVPALAAGAIVLIARRAAYPPGPAE